MILLFFSVVIWPDCSMGAGAGDHGAGLGQSKPCPPFTPTTTRRGCDIGRFKSLPPMEWKAFKKAECLGESLSFCFILFKFIFVN